MKITKEHFGELFLEGEDEKHLGMPDSDRHYDAIIELIAWRKLFHGQRVNDLLVV